jgi:hypothetical protein
MRLLLTVLALGVWSSSALADPRDRDYRPGEVREIQERLIELEYAKRRHFEVDGVFGGQTRDAIRDFQRDHNIQPADGEAGPRTVEALFGDDRGGGDGNSGTGQQQAGRGQCKGEEIASTGDARPLEGWAMRLAKKNWREEARARYGEEWADFSNARVSMTKCFEASVGGVPLKRCRIEATPCRS